MIKHTLLKISGRIIQGIILLIAFFIITLAINDCYYYLRKSLRPWLPVKIDKQIIVTAKCYRNLLKDGDTSNHLFKIIQKQIKSELLRNKHVNNCTFALNGVADMSFQHQNIRNNKEWAYIADEEMMQVFDIKLEEGRWYNSADMENNIPPVVLTRDHANELGITQLSSSSVFKFKSRKKDIDFRVVGITESIGKVPFEGRRHPMFIPIIFDGGNWVGEMNIIIKPKTNADIEELKSDLESYWKDKGWDQYFYKYHVESIQDRIHQKFIDHLRYFRIDYGIVGVILCFVFIILFGSIWQQVNKRVVEIGIRRAIGAPKIKVISLILTEVFVFLLIVNCIAVIIYFNVYSILHIKYYLISPLVAMASISILVFISALVPAYRASTIHPVKALSDE